MKKRFWCILLAAAVVLSLAACGKAPAKTSEAVSLGNGGVMLTVPAQFADLVIAKEGKGNELFTVSEKASVEAGKKHGLDEDSGVGWLFGIVRATEEEARKLRCADMSGEEFFAKDEEGNYYLLTHPTDVRIERDGDVGEKDMAQWSALNEWARDVVPDAFIKDNPGLEPAFFGNSDVDIHLARIAFSDEKYTVSTTEYGPLEPNGVDPTPYLDKLMNGVTYEYIDGEAPDGEYIVLRFPDEDVRLDFYTDNTIRRVYGDDNDNAVRYKATFVDGETNASDVMQDWYNALAAQKDMDTLGYTPESFPGRWAEKIAGRGLIEITKGDAEGEYKVEITWSSSAFEQARWEMTAKPTASNVLGYANAKHTVRTYKSESEYTDDVKYENGTGKFTLNSANEILWQDDIDHAGDNTVFISAG